MTCWNHSIDRCIGFVSPEHYQVTNAHEDRIPMQICICCVDLEGVIDKVADMGGRRDIPHR